MSAREGTRLSMIRHTTSPYMDTGIDLSTPAPPSVLVSYRPSLSKAVSPFRASIAGTIHDIEDIKTTNSGLLCRKFKLADDEGQWIHCVAHGSHAEHEFLQNMHHIVAYFGCGRSSYGTMPQALWLFKDSFMVPLGRRRMSSLSEQVVWRQASV